MSKLYYKQGNGFFYSNIKNVDEFPTLKSKFKKVTVYNPSSKREEEKDRYETKFINGKLKYLNFFDNEYVKAKEVLSITIEDKDGIEHVVQLEPFWSAATTKSGNSFSYIIQNYFKSIAGVIDKVNVGDEITLAINDKYTQKDASGAVRKTRDGKDVYYEAISILIKNEEGKTVALRNDEGEEKDFEWDKIEKKNFRGDVTIDYNGQEELSYYYDKASSHIEKIKDSFSGGSGSTPTSDAVANEPNTPKVESFVEDGDELDLPF